MTWEIEAKTHPDRIKKITAWPGKYLTHNIHYDYGHDEVKNHMPNYIRTNIYVPPELQDEFDRARADAITERQGIGYILLMAYKRDRERRENGDADKTGK